MSKIGDFVLSYYAIYLKIKYFILHSLKIQHIGAHKFYLREEGSLEFYGEKVV
jgi:hypothetical protein